jgi:hypothetical protein
LSTTASNGRKTTKGEVAMKYNKPEVVALGSAARVVRGMDKAGPLVSDFGRPQKTIGAYEADE